MIGIGVSLRHLRGTTAGSFTPLSLFTGGEEGAWYDTSDISTLFQDSVGTTPVTASGQTVGLFFDKSQGQTLGPELVTNGTFDTDLTGWTLSGSPAWVSGRAELSRNGGIDIVRQSFSTTVGALYRITADVTGTRGKLGIGVSALDDSILNVGSLVNTSVDRFFVATTNPTWLYLITEVTGTSSWDNISVREIAGNHATQPTVAARPSYIVDADGAFIQHDLVDDALTVVFPDLGTSATVAYVTRSEVVLLENQTISGSYNLPTVEWANFVAIDRALTASEKANLTQFLASKVVGVNA